MRKKIFSLLIVLFMLALIASPVLAQDYGFKVTKETVTVTVTPNGTANIEYSYSFVNNASAHQIDFVDVGVPNSNYNSGQVGGCEWAAHHGYPALADT